VISYAESDDDDDEDEVFKPLSGNSANTRAAKRRKVSVAESEDEFGMDEATEAAMASDGMTFIGL
jgi:DNA mismatch repair protein MSH6